MLPGRLLCVWAQAGDAALGQVPEQGTATLCPKVWKEKVPHF